MSTLLTDKEAIAELAAQSGTQDLQFADENPHWWIGRSSDGRFYWTYECCGEPYCTADEHETFDTIEQLQEHLAILPHHEPRWRKSP